MCTGFRSRDVQVRVLPSACGVEELVVLVGLISRRSWVQIPLPLSPLRPEQDQAGVSYAPWREVRSLPQRSRGVAQMEARSVRVREVAGSIPVTPTTHGWPRGEAAVLQAAPRRFDSCTVQTPEWRNGRRTRFSDGRSRDRGGSTPLSGIMRAWRNGRRTRLRIWRSMIVEVRLLSPALLLDLELDADTIDTHDSRAWRNRKTHPTQNRTP